MLEAGRNWQLFGYDTRALGKYWLGAWRSLWWAEESPVRRHFDEVVCLHREDGAALYQAGRECPPAPFVCEAIALPDDLVLARQLRLPLAVEPDLAAVIALEVSANSPFTGGDTSHGWQVLGRGDEQLRVLLVIVSRSAVMTYLGRQYGIHDARAREVWAQVDGASVVLHGFGEERRETLYRRRLRKCGLMLAAAAALLFTVVAVAAGVKRAELLQIEARAASAQREAAVMPPFGRIERRHRGVQTRGVAPVLDALREIVIGIAEHDALIG